ncbi:hypothetical protein FRC09_010873 [Ceratobasidium sp. 395]|nr:hypothetical protein FRC09_010873 [Ceratobasidium sp. 395]
MCRETGAATRLYILAATTRTIFFSSQDAPSNLLHYHFLFILALVFAAAYIYVIRLCLQQPGAGDASDSETLRVAPGRSLTVSKGGDELVFRDRTPRLEETANAVSTSDRNTSLRQHSSVRSSIVQAVAPLAAGHTKPQDDGDGLRRDASCLSDVGHDPLDSVREGSSEVSKEGQFNSNQIGFSGRGDPTQPTLPIAQALLSAICDLTSIPEALIEDQDSSRVPRASRPDDEPVTIHTAAISNLNRCAPLVQAPDRVEPDPTSLPKRASSTPTPVVDHGRQASEVPQTTRLALRGASLPTVRDNNHDPITIFTPLTTKPVPLKQTLYVGSKDLTRITTLDILVVPNGDGGEIKDPEIDAEYLCKHFGALDNVNVQRIPEHEVTLDQVNEAVTALWKAALPGACFLVFLSGHGCDNAMVLRDNGRIDESHLNSLFQTLRRTNPKPLRVAVVFDICRDNKEKEAVEMHDVSLIWSCSPGQQTWGFGFETLGEPCSVLLLGFLLAAHIASQSSGIFEEHFKDQVSRFARFNNHVRHVGGCDVCEPPDFCPKAFVMRSEFEQEVDLKQSQGFLNNLYSFLGEQEGFRELSKTVYEFMSKINTFRRSNELPIPENPIQGTDN